MTDSIKYPWDGGTASAEVRIWWEGECDPGGDLVERTIVGLGDHVDEGEPDLWVTFPIGEAREHVEWIAKVLEDALRPEALHDHSGFDECGPCEQAADEAVDAAIALLDEHGYDVVKRCMPVSCPPVQEVEVGPLTKASYELADFDPGDGHLHTCHVPGQVAANNERVEPCDCAAYLYCAAMDAEALRPRAVPAEGDHLGQIGDILTDPTRCTKFSIGVNGVKTGTYGRPGSCRELVGVAHVDCMFAALAEAGWSFVRSGAALVEPGVYQAQQAGYCSIHVDLEKVGDLP